MKNVEDLSEEEKKDYDAYMALAHKIQDCIGGSIQTNIVMTALIRVLIEGAYQVGMEPMHLTEFLKMAAISYTNMKRVRDLEE